MIISHLMELSSSFYEAVIYFCDLLTSNVVFGICYLWTLDCQELNFDRIVDNVKQFGNGPIEFFFFFLICKPNMY